jgi:hypothetical protein
MNKKFLSIIALSTIICLVGGNGSVRAVDCTKFIGKAGRAKCALAPIQCTWEKDSCQYRDKCRNFNSSDCAADHKGLLCDWDNKKNECVKYKTSCKYLSRNQCKDNKKCNWGIEGDNCPDKKCCLDNKLDFGTYQ